MNILQQQPGIGGFQEQEITIHLSQTLSWPTLKLLFVDFKLDFENFRLGFDKQGPICIAKIPKKLCGEILKRLKTNNYVVTCTSDEEMGSVSYGTNLPTQEGYPFRRILLLKPIHALYLKLKYNLKAHEKPDQLRLSLCSKAGGRGDHLVIDAIASQKESGERLSVLIQKMLQCLQEQAYFDLRLTVEECQLLYQRVQLFEKLPTIQKLDVVFLSSATRYESAKQPLPQVSLPQVSLPQVSLPQGSLTEQSSVGHNDTALLQNGWLFTVTCAGLCTVDILRAVHELSEMLAQPVLTLPLPLVATDQAGSLAKITTGHITKVEVPPPVPESQIRCIAKETKSVPTKDVKATKAEVLTWSDRVQLSREREVKHKKQIEPAGVNQQQQQQYHPFQCRPHLYEGPVNKSECEKEKCPKSEKEDYITTRHLMLNEMERGFMAVHRRKTCATLLRKKCINFEWFPSTNFEGDVVQLAGANDLVVQGLASRIYVDVDAILQSLYEKTFELFLAVPVESSSSKEKDVEQVLDMEMVFRKCRSLASNYVKHDLYFMVFRNYEQKELRINLLGTQPAAIHQLAIEIAKQYPATKSCPSCFIGNSSEELEGFPLSRLQLSFLLVHRPRNLEELREKCKKWNKPVSISDLQFLLKGVIARSSVFKCSKVQAMGIRRKWISVASEISHEVDFFYALVPDSAGLVLHTIGKKDVVLDYIRKYLVIAETIKERKVALPKGLFSYFMGKLLSHIGDFREAFSIEAFFDVPSCSIQLTGTHKNIQHAIEDLVLQIRRLLPQEKTTVTLGLCPEAKALSKSLSYKKSPLRNIISKFLGEVYSSETKKPIYQCVWSSMEDKKESKSDKKRLLVLTLCAPQANAVAFSIQKWLIEQLPLFMTDKGPQIYTSRPRIPSIKDLIVS